MTQDCQEQMLNLFHNGFETLAICVFLATPKIKPLTNEETTITVEKNETLTLKLPFAASPEPTVTWVFADATIRTGDRSAVETGDQSASLTMRQMTKDDSGIYTATVENELGKDSVEFKVVVNGKKKIKIPNIFQVIINN